MSKFSHDADEDAHRRRRQGFVNTSTFSSKTAELKMAIRVLLKIASQCD